jgi:hypothetical protein
MAAVRPLWQASPTAPPACATAVGLEAALAQRDGSKPAPALTSLHSSALTSAAPSSSADSSLLDTIVFIRRRGARAPDVGGTLDGTAAGSGAGPSGIALL